MQTDISKKRNKRITKNIIWLFLIRGAGLGITFLYVPLLLHTLKSVEYGIWLTLTSIVAWVSMFDLGLGNGLRNKLSEALAKDEIQKAKELTSTAYCCLWAFAIAILVLFAILYPVIPWTSVLNAPEELAPVVNPLAFIVITSFCLRFVFSLIQSVLYAVQMPALSSFTMLLGQALAYIAIYVESQIFGIDSLLILGSTISIVPLLAFLTITLIVFCGRYKNIRPSIKLYRKEYVKSIFSLGIQFFILQIITIVLYQTNNIIIAQRIGPADVVVYNIAYKLMQCPLIVFTIIVTPIWSAATEAYTRNDFEWLRRINNKLLKITGLLTLGGVIMLVLSPWIYKIWLNKGGVNIPFIVSAILLAQVVFQMLYSTHGTILNGIGKLKLQLIVTSVIAILYIPATLFASSEFGLIGIISMFALCGLLNFVWSSLQFNKIINRKATGIWNA